MHYYIARGRELLAQFKRYQHNLREAHKNMENEMSLEGSFPSAEFQVAYSSGDKDHDMRSLESMLDAVAKAQSPDVRNWSGFLDFSENTLNPRERIPGWAEDFASMLSGEDSGLVGLVKDCSQSTARTPLANQFWRTLQQDDNFKDRIYTQVARHSCVNQSRLSGKPTTGSTNRMRYREGIFGNVLAMFKSICRGQQSGNHSQVYRVLAGNPLRIDQDALNQSRPFSSSEYKGENPVIKDYESGLGNLPLTYALLSSLMARESDFRAGTGVDTTNGRSLAVTSTREAGPVQVAYGSMPGSRSDSYRYLRQNLYNHYRTMLAGKTKEEKDQICHNPRNVREMTSIEANKGTDSEVNFQNLMKTCWALAAEYGALNIRLNYEEQGPFRNPANAKTNVQRRAWGKGKLNGNCYNLFTDMAEEFQRKIDRNPTVCNLGFPELNTRF